MSDGVLGNGTEFPDRSNTDRSNTDCSMTDGSDKPIPAAANAKLLFQFSLVTMWLMSVMGFTMPTETMTDQWQVLDLVKLVVLAVACFGGVFVLYTNIEHPPLLRILGFLMPFFAFFCWALLSTLWSALPTVTIFQSGGMAAMLFFATAVGATCRDEKTISKLLMHLAHFLLFSSLIVLIAYVIDPVMSGLDRERIHTGGDGIIHPTAAGATASLGLLIPTLCHVIGRFSWPKKMMIPYLLIHGAVIFLSNSRTATGLALLTIGFVAFWYSTNRIRARVLAGVGLVCLAFVLFDPGFKLWQSTAAKSAQYVTRGQSGDQLTGFSGRAEMWSAIWNEYKTSPLIGHGYFVTSETGSLYVWNERHNYTAHNLALQILASTGAIGFFLFGFALLQIVINILSLRHGNLFQRRFVVIIVVLWIWFLGWAQLGDAFMGPIRPESIVFFTMLGIGIGQAALQLPPQTVLPQTILQRRVLSVENS